MKNIKVLFVSSANRNSISPIVRSQGESISNKTISVDYFGINGKGFIGYIRNIPRLWSYIRKSKPDIIHAHYSLSGFVAGLSGFQVPKVISLMGSDTKAGSLMKILIRIFARYYWDQVIVKSISMKEDISLSDCHIIPNGVNLSVFHPINKSALKEQFFFSTSKKTILFLADPERESKNFILAKEACGLINNDNTDFQVRFNLSHKDVAEVLNAADVLLLTSKWEGSPNVIKEAMACNCPVVATDVGDIRWLLGDEPGHFLTSFEPEDVARKIKEALIFSEQVGRTNGRSRIIELGLDAQTVANKLIEIYKSLLKNG